MIFSNILQLTGDPDLLALAQRLVARAEEFEELGLVIEAFGEGAVVIREVPGLLGDGDEFAYTNRAFSIDRLIGTLVHGNSLGGDE